ncbi:hypothetical protein GH714_009323 [Hevea brasiliensis]|uniref:RRM domain-containing protein n=1 Tax=Hevea brasiliensis TaxID=3981 RepID=A0A6A6N181_HEVBR|nr:hypothetical protein GH714_009323 [Hevea brasiliensis]
MAFWIWLERARLVVGDLVNKMLFLPETFNNSLADEAVLCLNCIGNDQFHLSPAISSDIPLIHRFSKTSLSLQFFHGNRLAILREVSNIVNEVCLRAFEDILQQVENLKLKVVDDHEVIGNIRGKEMMNKHPFSVYGFPVINTLLPIMYNSEVHGAYGHMGNGGGYSSFVPGLDPYDLAIQTQALNKEIGDVLSHIPICTTDEKKDNVIPVDDRTIFLTFSKGYPISEDEIRDFFTRKYGDCIDAIRMQEVLGDHGQPLYARLVVLSPSIIGVILEGKNKAKFSINGKHVWARKYVRRNQRLFSSPPSSQPTSPTRPSKA